MSSLAKQLAELTAVNKTLVVEIRKLRDEMSRMNASAFDQSRFEVISASTSDLDNGSDLDADDQFEQPNASELMPVASASCKNNILNYTPEVDLDKWLYKPSKSRTAVAGPDMFKWLSASSRASVDSIDNDEKAVIEQ